MFHYDFNENSKNPQYLYPGGIQIDQTIYDETNENKFDDGPI